ncbi:MAG: type II secretion system protein [Burkholderiaceae bacterium]|nr:type II secretion system protein [Burkholderiaceae bacterium]
MRNARRQQGFTYLIALFMVATLSIVTLRALENSLTKDRRAKEAELLFVGQAYQQAIMNYYQNSPGSSKTYPQNLEALLEDKRTSTLQRQLRRLYFDPITASQDWGILKDSDGKVMGVYSMSTQKPIKVNGFPDALCSFNGATTYQSWQFVYPPNACSQSLQNQQN